MLAWAHEKTAVTHGWARVLTLLLSLNAGENGFCNGERNHHKVFGPLRGKWQGKPWEPKGFACILHVLYNVSGPLQGSFPGPSVHLLLRLLLSSQGGDLFDAITSTNKYTERDASGMLYNLASAIKYLHSLNIVHRDIKPENLLVREMQLQGILSSKHSWVNMNFSLLEKTHKSALKASIQLAFSNYWETNLLCGSIVINVPLGALTISKWKPEAGGWEQNSGTQGV